MKTHAKRLMLTAIALAPLVFSGQVLAQRNADRLDELRTRISTMAKETSRVEDLTQIQRIQRSFGYYVDKGYFGEAADLFADNGRVQYGVDGIYTGKAHIKELFTRHGGGSTTGGPGLPFGRLNLNMQLQPMVTVSDDGMTAKARWRVWSLLGNYKQEVSWGDAILENDYVKENGVWKIGEMRYYTNFIAPYEGGWAAMTPASGDWKTEVSKVFPPDAPSPVNYKRFPDVYIPPYHFASDRSAIESDPPVTPTPRARDALGRLEVIADEQAAKLSRQRSLRAVENLQAMYGYYIDKGQWDEAASLFAEDGSWEFGQSGVYMGKDSVRSGLSRMGPEGLEPGQLNNYPMMQPIIHVSEDNSKAWGRFRSDVMLARGGSGQWGGGLYENEYVNDNGVWKIAKQHYWVTFWGDYDQGMTTGGRDPLAAAGDNLPDAPPTVEYESFPNTYIVPFHFPHPVTGAPHDDHLGLEQQGEMN